MRPRVIPMPAAPSMRQSSDDDCYETKARGFGVLNSPLLNKGTAFTAGGRRTEELGLDLVVSPDISTLEVQWGKTCSICIFP